MNWRILGAWVSLWLVWTVYAYSYQMTMQETVIATVIGTLIAGLIGWIALKAYSAIARMFKRKSSFSCCFTNHGPPGETDFPSFNFYEIQNGTSSKYVKVTCSYGIQIAQFGLRFITPEEMSKRSIAPRIPENIQSDIYILAIEKVLPLDLFTPQHQITYIDDQCGGWTINIVPPVQLANGKPIYIKFTVRAEKIGWSGKISFEGINEQTDRCYAESDAKIIYTSSEDDEYASIAPAYITFDAFNQKSNIQK